MTNLTLRKTFTQAARPIAAIGAGALIRTRSINRSWDQACFRFKPKDCRRATTFCICKRHRKTGAKNMMSKKFRLW